MVLLSRAIFFASPKIWGGGASNLVGGGGGSSDLLDGGVGRTVPGDFLVPVKKIGALEASLGWVPGDGA